MPSAPVIRYAVCISILKDPTKNMLKITEAVKFPLFIISFIGSPLGVFSQTSQAPPIPPASQAGQISPAGLPPIRNQPDTGQSLTLDQCVTYALKNQPALHQSLIYTDITRATNAISLSGWLPQVGISGNLTHYISLPTSFVKNSSTGATAQQKSGVINTTIPSLSATQTLFNPSLIYAAHVAPLYIHQAEQITDSTKINIVATVSKTFYSLLLTLQQINVLKEHTPRLANNVPATYHHHIPDI